MFVATINACFDHPMKFTNIKTTLLYLYHLKTKFVTFFVNKSTHLGLDKFAMINKAIN